MIEVRQTVVFKAWHNGLRDLRAAKIIAQRIVRLQSGLLGDVKHFDGMGEVRIDYGPGYRLYFVHRGAVLIILLCGGEKGSQSRDIATAKQMAKELQDGA